MHELSIPVAGSALKVKKAPEGTGGDVGETLGGTGDAWLGAGRRAD